MAYRDEVLADSPAEFYEINEASGVPLDTSGNGRNAGTGSALLRGFGLTKTGGGLHFEKDPPTRFFTGNAFKTTDGNPYSIEYWVETLDSTSTMTCLGDSGGSGANSRALHQIIAGVPHWSVWNTSSVQFDAFSAGMNIADGQAHHIVGTWGSSTSKLYVDKVEVASIATTGTIRGTGLLSAGNYAALTTQFKYGALDDFALYTTALSLTRIAAHYDAIGVRPDPLRRLASAATEALVLPAVSDLRIASITTEALVLPATTNRSIAGIAVECLIPVAGQMVDPGVVRVGAPTTPVYRLHEDGVWRALRVHPLN